MSKIIRGRVVSTKMQNTVVVRVETKYRHPVYKKVVVRHKNFKAHNEDKSVKTGDKVDMEETRPISKEKHFKVIKIIKS